MKIELTLAVIACLKRGLNCWPQQNFAEGLEIKEILKNDETETFKPDYNTEAVADFYQELLYAVESKYPGESRHDTALRYIRDRECHKIGALGATAKVTA